MRVAVLSTFQEPCGIATYTEDLVRELRALGVEILVLSPHARKGAAGWGDQPRLWNRNRAFGFEAVRTLRAMREFNPDVVHAQINRSLYSSRFLFTLGMLCQRARLPFVATLHGKKSGSLGSDFKLWRILYGMRNADLIVHTEAHRKELGRDRVHVIAHGMHPVRERPMGDARRTLGLDTARRVLAHVGFLVPDKGVLEVMQAVHALHVGGERDIYYWIAGGAYSSKESQAYFARLEQVRRDLSLEDHVHLAGGFIEDERLMIELSAADWVFLNYAADTSQGASGAVRRALSSGRPVAVSRAPIFDDVREAVHTIGDGPLAPAIAGLFNDQLAQDARARALRFCETHSWRNIARQHVELFNEVLSRKKSVA